METTRVFSQLVDALADPAVRVVALKGGARSSKTYSILQAFAYMAIRAKSPLLLSVVSETLPHLKRGAIRDFRRILETEGYLFTTPFWNETDHIARFGPGAIEFFSADAPAKVLGPARDYLFINECINLGYDTVRQLMIRTRRKVVFDYNPAWPFWIDAKILPRDDTRLIRSTYLDNDYLTAEQVREIEAQREIDPAWWRVYGLGETGQVEGLVLENWDICGSMPEAPGKEWLGIDFGFGAPTAVVHVALSGGETYHDEVVYARDLTNPEIAERIRAAGLAHLTCIADSAEPKSIQELRNAGLHVEPADKGADSVRVGIQIMNRIRKHFTTRSVNLIDEARKWHYFKNTDGAFDRARPVDAYNHGMDAARYVYLNRLGDTRPTFAITY